MMETITRIHIARVAYDIEIGAQTKLQKYLTAVKRGLDDDTAEEVMNDIELRITELLAERGVHDGGIITTADVRFVEEQLGAPDQFAQEPDAGNGGRPRRLLRDPDNGLIGGVASGLGLYFSIDPLIFRLVFVALAFAGGAGVLLYILLWILVPAASNSAEKLQMQGKAVTAATLQSYRQTMGRTLRSSGTMGGRVVIKVLKIVTTVVASLTLLGIATGVAVATSALFTQPLRPLVRGYRTNDFAVGAMWLFALSLITLLVLFVRQIWQRKPSTARRVTFLGALAALVISVTTMAGLAPVIANHYNDLYGNGKTTTALPITGTVTSTSITTLKVTADSTLQLTYVASDQPLHATYQATPGMKRPNITVSVSGDTATVSAPDLHSVVPECLVHDVCNNVYLPVKVTLYGPGGLQNIVSDSGASVTISGSGGLNVDANVTAANGTMLILDNDSYGTLTLNASSNAQIFASSTSAATATIVADATSTINAPAATSLIASVPAPICDEGDSQPIIFLSNAPATIVLNGKAIAPQNVQDLGGRCFGAAASTDFRGTDVQSPTGAGIPQ